MATPVIMPLPEETRLPEEVAYVSLLGECPEDRGEDAELRRQARKVWRLLHDTHGKYMLREWSAGGSISSARRLTSDDGNETSTKISELAANLFSKRKINALFTYPGVLVESAIGEVEESPYTLNSWRRSVLLCEIAIQCLEEEVRQGSRPATELLLQAQWSLFIVLSAPLRPNASEPWHEKNRSHANIVGVYSGGRPAGGRYMSRLQNVRDTLLDALEHFEDYVTLRQASSRDLEKVAALLVFTDCDRRSLLELPRNLREWCKAHLKDSNSPAKQKANTSPKSDMSIQLDTVEQLVEGFFLPRFDLKTARKAARATAPRGLFICAQISFIVGVVAFGVALAAFIVPGWQIAGLEPWIFLSILAFLCIFGPAVFLPRLAQQAWLLRVPASAGMGVLILVAFSSQWWKESWIWPGALGHLYAACFFLVLAWFYIFFEVSSHRVGKTQSFWRATCVFVIVLATSILVTMLAFGLLFPVFAENVDVAQSMDVAQSVDSVKNEGVVGLTFFKQLEHQLDGPWERILILLLPASLVTVIGLFTQVLWDEKAITAPLAHTTWRR